MSKVFDMYNLCYDCGSAAKHQDCENYCRKCSNKNNGGSHAYTTIIDNDKLRAKLGEPLAAEVIAECVVSWLDEKR